MTLICEHEKMVNDDRAVLKGLIAGTIGGLVASWMMDEFQGVWSKASEAIKNSRRNISNDSPSSTQVGSPNDSENQEPATINAAAAISENIFGHPLEEREKKIAGDLGPLNAMKEISISSSIKTTFVGCSIALRILRSSAI